MERRNYNIIDGKLVLIEGVKKKKRFLTDRCWIPLCLTKENRAKKWLGIIVLVAFLFLISWLILIFCGVARGEEFYKDWVIVEVVSNDEGLWGIILQNPEDKTEAVLIILMPLQIIPLKEKPPEVRVQGEKAEKPSPQFFMNRTYKKIFCDKNLLNEMLEKLKNGESPTSLARFYHCDHSSIFYQRDKHLGKLKKIIKNIACKRDTFRFIPQSLPIHETFGEKINRGKTYAEYVTIQNKRLEKYNF